MAAAASAAEARGGGEQVLAAGGTDREVKEALGVVAAEPAASASGDVERAAPSAVGDMPRTDSQAPAAPAADAQDEAAGGRARPPPEEFRREVVLDFDLKRYPFQEIIREILGEPLGADLGRLHATEHAQQVLACFARRNEIALGPRSNPWNRRFLSCPQADPELSARFVDTYHDFLRSFVLNELRTERVVFQASPTFRCHIPHCGSIGRPHRDEDYKHPVCEVNFWIPLTEVFGNNSLHRESERGRGDFRPLELSPGQLVRFYGNQVWHYTVPNNTDNTRISIDFRVIREEEWSLGAFADFKLGAYYSVMTRAGVLERTDPEFQRLQEAYCAAPPPKKTKRAAASAPSAAEP